MKRFFAAFLILASTQVSAQEIGLELKGDVIVVKVAKVITILEDRTVVRSLPFTVTAPKGGILYQWQYPAGIDAIRKGNVLEVKAAPKGSLTISVEYATVDFDKRTVDQKFGHLTFDVGDVPQPVPPTPPVPPIPDPTPKPVPPPPPIPTPAPIPVAGFRVLVIYEATKGAALLTPKQSNELYSKAVADYLNAKCVKEGNQPGWRIWDRDTPVVGAAKHWADAFNRTRANIPWIIISDGINGVTSFEGPLPDGGILDLLKKHGGN